MSKLVILGFAILCLLSGFGLVGCGAAGTSSKGTTSFFPVIGG